MAKHSKTSRRGRGQRRGRRTQRRGRRTQIRGGYRSAWGPSVDG